MGRYIVLMDNNTGRMFSIDLYYKRYKRMVDRISQWFDMVKVMYPDTPAFHITVTYDMKKYEWDAKQISKFINNLMKKKLIYDYAWVMEIQANGNPHYHIVTIADEEFDYYWPWCQLIGTTITGPWSPGVGYLLDHTTKAYQKDFSRYPRGARLFGVSKVSGLTLEMPEDRDSMSSQCDLISFERDKYNADRRVEIGNQGLELLDDMFE